MEWKTVESDVLIIGGGPAGCMAAINASNQNINVVLVDKSGFGKGSNGIWAQDGKPLKFTIQTSSARYFRDKEVSEAAQGMYSKAGFDVDVKIMEWASYISDLNQHKMPFHLIGMEHPGDPYIGILFTFKSGAAYNVVDYENSRIDTLLEQLGVENDAEKRKVMWAEFIDIAAAEVPYIPIMQPLNLYAARENVQDSSGHLNGFPLFSNENFDARNAVVL
tara:strand:- start:147 stop:806 length:660 start_codon:yes stop_codon:yes gene_type:complete